MNDVLPAGFHKLDCMMVLSAQAMHDMHIEMYMSDAHVCLVPKETPIEHAQKGYASPTPKTDCIPTANSDRTRYYRAYDNNCLSPMQQFVEFGHMAMP